MTQVNGMTAGGAVEGSAAGADRELVIEHWIGGLRSSGDTGRWGTVYNPASGAASARVALANAADVDRAVRAASEAFGEWGRSGLGRRTNILFRFRELVL